MSIGYIGWSIIAMISYSFVFLFAKLAMANDALSAFTVMTISTVLVAVAATVVTVITGEWTLEAYASSPALFAYATGISLALAVLGYFIALETGPASIVVPIYGMFIIGGSVLGIVVLNEPVTVRKVLGIGLAATSVILIAS